MFFKKNLLKSVKSEPFPAHFPSIQNFIQPPPSFPPTSKARRGLIYCARIDTAKIIPLLPKPTPIILPPPQIFFIFPPLRHPKLCRGALQKHRKKNWQKRQIPLLPQILAIYQISTVNPIVILVIERIQRRMAFIPGRLYLYWADFIALG